MTETMYGIAVRDLNSGQTYGENEQTLFETMSGIKSVIGTLALEKAACSDINIDSFTLSVTNEHYSNGSGELKYQLGNDIEVLPIAMSLRSLVALNTGDSDCVATNTLIDYLDGKDAVNSRITKSLGLDAMSLVTDKINFLGVDHYKQPFQVGLATMQDFANYYQTIWSADSNWRPSSGAHSWHQGIHAMVRNARLFGVQQIELPPEVNWLHKTGSGSDTHAAGYYNTSMDAGMLQVDGRTLVVAAGNTTIHRGNQVLCEETIEQNFALRNQNVLSEFGVPEIVRESVAA